MACGEKRVSRNVISLLSSQQKTDVQGVARGRCTMCAECPQFLSCGASTSVLCQYCGCPPARHNRASRSVQSRKRRRVPASSESIAELTDTCEERSDSDYDSSSPCKVKKSRAGGWRPWYQETAPPPRLGQLLARAPAAREEQELHAWNNADASPNIYVRQDDALTFHRNPVYQTSDAIRGRGQGPRPSNLLGLRGSASRRGYLRGLHVWAVHWPQESRGTHPVVGVATRECPLTEPGYKRLVGSTVNSWGWCLKSLRIYHDNDKFRGGLKFPQDVDDMLVVPDTFHMILDMDRGTLAFQVKEDFLGVAFSGLRGLELFPIVSAVWGHCEVTLTYINGHELSEDESR